MKLTIKRDQSDIKGMFGGHKGVSFKLFGQCLIIDDEKALIEKYKVGEYAVATRKIQARDNIAEIRITVYDLVRGSTHQTTDLGELQSLEDQMKEGCQHLKMMLRVMSTFGGEEVFEI